MQSNQAIQKQSIRGRAVTSPNSVAAKKEFFEKQGVIKTQSETLGSPEHANSVPDKLPSKEQQYVVSKTQELNSSFIPTADNTQNVQSSKDREAIEVQLQKVIEAQSFSFTCLDFKGLRISKLQLEQLNEALQYNKIIGHIRWGKFPIDTIEVRKSIEEKIITNNRNFKYHPSDFIHALLSSHAYCDSHAEETVAFTNQKHDEDKSHYNKYLNNWAVHAVHVDKASGYYGAIYLNKQDGQLVLAHRGTKVRIGDLIAKDSALRTDIEGILQGKIVNQQAQAYLFTQYAIDYAKKYSYSLSFTGHSLGAWLAELSIFHVKIEEWLDEKSWGRTKAVTFDSPGSAIHIEKLQSSIKNYRNDFSVNVKYLPIVTYLSHPNFINSCNEHVGRLYGLFPQINDGFINKAADWIKNMLFKKDHFFYIDGLLSVSGHKMHYILSTFDTEIDAYTRHPNKIKEIQDWPVIQNPLIHSQTEKAFKFTTFVGKLVDTILPSAISIATIKNLLGVIKDLIQQKINLKEYFNCIKYYNENSDCKSAIKKFAVFYKSHYKTKELDLKQDVLSPEKNNTDWHLKKLIQYNISTMIDDISTISKRQLEEIRCMYKTHPSSDKTLIKTINHSVTVDEIRTKFSRLIDVNSEVKHILDNLHQMHNNDNKNNKKIFKIITHKLKNKQIVVISGEESKSKKSVLIKEYIHIEQPTLYYHLFLADNSTSIEKEYQKFAERLGINYNTANLLQEIYDLIDTADGEFMFIFQQVQSYQDIKKYLENLPKQIKVIIITDKTNLTSELECIKLPYEENQSCANDPFALFLHNKTFVEKFDKNVSACSHTPSDYSTPIKTSNTIVTLPERIVNQPNHPQPSKPASREDKNKLVTLVAREIHDTLDEIEWLSNEGIWSTGLISPIPASKLFPFLSDSRWNFGVKGYSSEKYLKKELKYLVARNWAPEKDILEIAQMLCFKAICTGMIKAKSLDFVCAYKFAEYNPHVLQVIYNKYQGYFVNKDINEILQYSLQYAAALALDGNFTGQGSTDYVEKSYWNEYSKEALEKILKLRLVSSKINIEEQSIKILTPNYTINKYTASKLTQEIVDNLMQPIQQLLVTISLSGHWVGIAIAKTSDELVINYLDSEQNLVPSWLKEEFTKIITTTNNLVNTAYINEVVLTRQESNNCGSELIENLIFYLTGTRLEQKYAVAIQSLLYEDMLISNYSTELKQQYNYNSNHNLEYKLTAAESASYTIDW